MKRRKPIVAIHTGRAWRGAAPWGAGFSLAGLLALCPPDAKGDATSRFTGGGGDGYAGSVLQQPGGQSGSPLALALPAAIFKGGPGDGHDADGALNQTLSGAGLMLFIR